LASDEMDDFEAGGIPDFLRDPFGTVRRYWPKMLVTLLLGLTATVVFVARQQPLYASFATVLVTSQQIREDLVRSTVQEDSFQRINALINSLLSLNTLTSLIEQYELYPQLRDSMTLAEIAAVMRSHVTIEAEQGAGWSKRDSARVYSITYEHPDPNVAANVANALAAKFTDESIRLRTQQANLATSFLKSELERAESALREQAEAVRKFQERHRGELPGDLQANLMRLDRLQQQRQSLAMQITEAENRRALVAQGSDGDTALTTPEQRLESLRAKLRVELEKYTEEHPNVVLLRNSIARLEEEIAASPPASRTDSAAPVAAQLEITALRNQLRATEVELEQLDQHVTRTPAREEELSALQERETVLRENYLNFLRKVQQAELAQSLEAAQQGARFSIADRAVPPTKPTRARMKFLILGVFASFGLAAGVGLLFEALDPVLVSRDQIEALGSVPVLGSAPRLRLPVG